MLKYIRYILSTRQAAKIHKQHMQRLHMMPSDDIIGIALWHCVDWLEFRKPLTLDQRLNVLVSHPAPNAGELLKAVESVYDVISHPEERYVKSIPSWCNRPDITKVADRWLVDQDGYYVNMNTVVKQLQEQLETIYSAVNDPKNEDYKYHYTKKPKDVYLAVTSFIKHFH